MSSAFICFNSFPLLQSHTGSYHTSMLLSTHANNIQGTIKIPAVSKLLLVTNTNKCSSNHIDPFRE